MGERENKVLLGNKLDLGSSSSLAQTRLAELDKYSFRDIKVAPFSVEKFCVEFGLIPHAPEDEEDDWSVTVEPRDYMCFYEP